MALPELPVNTDQNLLLLLSEIRVSEDGRLGPGAGLKYWRLRIKKTSLSQ